jgi:RsiW-degrading membrane proteinase PrsW (M82 family)
VDRAAGALMLGLVGALLRDRRGEPRVVLPALVVIALTFLAGMGATTLARTLSAGGARAATPEGLLARAQALSASGRYEAAEAIYARLAREAPSVEGAMGLVENHGAALAANALASRGEDGSGEPARHANVMSDEALETLLDGMPPGVTLVTRFWRGLATGGVSDDLRSAVVIAAEKEPPLPWANHALATDALARGDLATAGARFEREGLAFPERARDIDAALAVWIRQGAWDHVHERLRDPRVRAAASSGTRNEIAIHDEDWLGMAKNVVIGWRQDSEPWALVISGVAALAWAFVCTRLGKLREAWKRRLPLYAIAFALGVASVVPTIVLIAVEQSKLHLVETGDATRDVLFFVFGVGFREEACKLLLFAPLLPFLRRSGGGGRKLDILVCGAMVGLGFAAEENLGYLARGDLHAGLARFLVANFFHMALTGTLAAALDELVSDREANAMPFTKTALTVIALHGAYDFLLSHEEYGGSFMAMLVFIFLTRAFLEAVDRARRGHDRGLPLLHAFVLAIGVVTGVAAVRAVTALGPWNGALVMGEGLLGEGIILFVFVRTLRAM